MIFKVIDQRLRSQGLMFTLWTHSRINILQWILVKLGTYLVLKRIWNLLIYKVIGQGHQISFLGEGIWHALRCPCFILFFFGGGVSSSFVWCTQWLPLKFPLTCISFLTKMEIISINNLKKRKHYKFEQVD